MTPAVEFSHIVTVDPWPEDGITVELSASPAECEALRRRFELEALDALEASAGIERQAGELVLAGVIRAEVVQSCVVTLKPVRASLEAPFERRYRRPGLQEATGQEKPAATDGKAATEDEIDCEILDGGRIDLGEVIAEEFFLALDPYPRAADADRYLDEVGTNSGISVDEPPASPFEKLRHH